MHPECYQILIENAEANEDVDVVACAFDTFLDGTIPDSDSHIEKYDSIIINGGNCAAESMVSADKKTSVRGLAWNKCYKRELLDKVRFDENLIICEDSIFSWEIMKIAGKILLIQSPLYHYRKRKDGSTAKADFKKNYTALEAYSRMIYDVLSSQVVLREPYKNELFRQFIYWIMRTAGSNGSNLRSLKALEKFIELVPDEFDMAGLSRETRRKYAALKISPKSYMCEKRIWVCYNKAKAIIKNIRK